MVYSAQVRGMNPSVVLSALCAELQECMPEDQASSKPESLQLKTETEKKAGNLIVRSGLDLEQNSIFGISTCRKRTVRSSSKRSPLLESTERRAIIDKTVGGMETSILTTHRSKACLALLELGKQAGKPLMEPVHSKTLEIIKRLELVDNGRNYKGIKRSLHNLRQISITFGNSSDIPQKTKHTDLSDTTNLNHLRVYERKNKGAQRTYGYGESQFGRYILENLINNDSHVSRLDIVKEFKKHRDTTILLYTYLDRCLAFRDKCEINLEELFERMNLSQQCRLFLQPVCPAAFRRGKAI